MNELTIQHSDNGQIGTFFIKDQDKRLAELTYEYINPQTIDANHTFVDPSLRNQGIGDKLLKALLQFTEQKQLKIIASCSYVAAKLRKYL
ncbi:acetyltransferase [Gallibacterium salpingitidis]|uniref:GNAT family N-acetyltransferase n=1 Tax=Gallibacterium salpingitidis TaxID=505341 RepID=UPI000805AC5D|nr:GNAT family N-acetyltransferase [Gallibacterium salpingitidis]OBX05528.1 acetyltransferase [Gallibacterium salpingitidis]WKS98910.1 N-acetyltransferase [Gallibacterium salpingitidis]